MSDDELVPETIVCVDCLETAHLITPRPSHDELPLEPGDVVVYRCSGCGDRWDVEIPERAE